MGNQCCVSNREKINESPTLQQFFQLENAQKGCPSGTGNPLAPLPARKQKSTRKMSKIST